MQRFLRKEICENFVNEISVDKYIKTLEYFNNNQINIPNRDFRFTILIIYQLILFIFFHIILPFYIFQYFILKII